LEVPDIEMVIDSKLPYALTGIFSSTSKEANMAHHRRALTTCEGGRGRGLGGRGMEDKGEKRD